MPQQAAKLAYFCRETANKIGDEVLQAESLILLHDVIYNEKLKQNIKHLMQPLFSSTHHIDVREKMHCYFKDLNIVMPDITAQITSLVERLTGFDFTFSV